jgi:ribonuclease R
MIHRLLDRYFEVMEADFKQGPVPPPRGKDKLSVADKMGDVPTKDELVDVGSFISYTERRSESAERELKSVKVLQLLADEHVGDEFRGVVTGITNFGLFIQIETYLAEGLVRYEDLLDDWWDVDSKAGVIRGQRSGTVVRIGDVVQTRIVRVDVPKRELDLAVLEVLSRGKGGTGKAKKDQRPARDDTPGGGVRPTRTGSDKRAQRSKSRDKSKQSRIEKRT